MASLNHPIFLRNTNINLDNKKNSEDSDCEIGSKEHVEPKVEDVIDNHSQYWWLIPYCKSVQNSNVLKEDK